MATLQHKDVSDCVLHSGERTKSCDFFWSHDFNLSIPKCSFIFPKSLKYPKILFTVGTKHYQHMDTLQQMYISTTLASFQHWGSDCGMLNLIHVTFGLSHRNLRYSKLLISINYFCFHKLKSFNPKKSGDFGVITQMIIILIKYIYTKTQKMNLNSLYIYSNRFIFSQKLQNPPNSSPYL